MPGKVVAWINHEFPFATAHVEFAGVKRQVSMQCVPGAELGDYVLVHAGIAISRIDPDEAASVLKTLEELGLSQDEFPVDDPV